MENLGKKEDKIKIKLIKNDNIFGFGEIILPPNQKSNKISSFKKWYNINSSLPQVKEQNISLTKRNSAPGNLALNLINSLKVHFQITNNFIENISSTNSRSIMDSDEIKKISENNKNKIKKENFDESKDIVDSLSNNTSKIYKNTKENNDKNKHRELQNFNDESVKFTNLKERSLLYNKPGHNNNILKKSNFDGSLSQSLNSMNFQMIKNSLNNCVVEKKQNDHSMIKDRVKNKEENIISEKEKVSNFNTSANLKKKTLSMINPNGIVGNNLKESPNNKSANNLIKKKEINTSALNTVRTTTNQNSLNINYGKKIKI